ncbi:MAG TPA: hypothetical protein VGM73_06410 [Candidatus Didemnitutus sp.]
MNPSVHLRRAARLRQLCYFLATRLLRFASFAAAALPLPLSVRAARESRPYLTVVMASPLRFAEAPVYPPPPAPKPAIPAGSGPVTIHAPHEKPDVIVPSAVIASDPGAEPTSESAEPHDAKPPMPADKSATPPAAILPDETRAKVHAEDFLPYFQFPGAGPNPNDVIVAPTPAEPGKLPPSSASYRQQ